MIHAASEASVTEIQPQTVQKKRQDTAVTEVA